MKILVVCQHYYPEPFRITDICEELVRMGHEVSVITGTPNYPLGEIYEGYEKGQRTDEVLNGVKVQHCKTHPRKTGTLNRLRNYFSFARSSKKYVKTLKEEFDVVFVNQLSPVMMADAGIAYKKKFGKKLVLYCLDLWPESLCVGGIKQGSLIYNVFKRISKKVYREADTILLTSRTFEGYMMEKFGIEKGKMGYLPQYAEEQFLSVKEKAATEEFHLLFAGNIGLTQSMPTIIDCVRILKDEKIVFDIVGDGTELESSKERAKDLSNVVFHGRKPFAEMPAYYEKADAMLITLTGDSFVAQTIPGKVQTYMAAGRAIVGAIGGETKIVLEESQGGYCGEADNAEALAENIRKLIASGQAAVLGKKNREYYLTHFAKEKFMKELIARLEEGAKE